MQVRNIKSIGLEITFFWTTLTDAIKVQLQKIFFTLYDIVQLRTNIRVLDTNQKEENIIQFQLLFCWGGSNVLIGWLTHIMNF